MSGGIVDGVTNVPFSDENYEKGNRRYERSKIVGMYDKYQLLRITRNEKGEKVDWLGLFGGVGEGTLIEGFAFEAVLKDGEPVLQRVEKGYTVRLYESSISYIPFPFFLWTKRGDANKQSWRSGRQVAKIPLVPVDFVSYDEMLNENYQRKICTLTPRLLRSGKVVIDAKFEAENTLVPQQVAVNVGVENHRKKIE